MRSEEELNAINEKYIDFLENDPSVILGEMSIREVVKKAGLGPFTQYLKVIEIRPLDDYKLWCRLRTGEIKIYDFTPQLEFPMYQHLKDKSKFNDVIIDEFGVPVWMDADGVTRDTDIGISCILIDGVNVPIELKTPTQAL